MDDDDVEYMQDDEVRLISLATSTSLTASGRFRVRVWRNRSRRRGARSREQLLPCEGYDHNPLSLLVPGVANVDAHCSMAEQG
jgi:hypothetical protein